MFLSILVLSIFSMANSGVTSECPALSFPANGRVDYDPNVGQFASYTCDEGYSLVGPNFLLCQANFTWSGDPPICEIKDCGNLTNPTNGVVEYNLTTFGEIANYSCNVGYSIGSGDSVIHCVASGSWNGTEANCTDIDECTLGTSNCDSNATCTNTIGSFTCSCDAGFSGDGVNCTDIDECTLGTSNCDSDATCTNTIGSFTCSCNNGFSGNGTTCSDIDECTLGTSNCDSNATCTNTIGSFTCTCDSGFSGDGVNCTDIDECNLMYMLSNCDSNATCTNTIGSFTCTCNSGFSGNGTTCSDIDECTMGTHTCGSNATCTNTIGSFTCTCDSGFTGDGVNCTDIDECTMGTSNCDSNATCTNTIGSFTCTCNSGFSGDGVNCTDIDECTLGTSNCDSNATCTNTIGSFTCTCIWGFTGNGTTCSDMDECTMGTHTCGSNATCTNTMGSFTCTCDAGFSGDGVNCTDIDECTLGTHTCDNNATCTNTIGSFTCTCDGGFSGNGFNCTDIDECTLGTSNCDSNATCTNIIGSFTCTCNSGFSGDGVNCTDIDECVSNPCLNMGYCINGIDMFTCNCTSGFTNVNCTPSVLYDDCSIRADVCDGIPNAECNGTVCACSTGHYDPGNATCVPVDCGSLSPPANGFVDTTPGTTYNLAASYTCDTGYNLTAGRIRFCLENGSWAGEDPMCILDDCGPLTNITNGYVSTPGGTTYNQTATYVCDTGYFISAGNESRVCQDGGAWSGVEPNCTIYDCRPLSNISNGVLSTPGGTTYLQIANYTCDSGYSISMGDQIRVCLDDGNWNGTEPTCSDIDECSLGTSTCDANATCANNVGSFICTCNNGFSGDGNTCSDIDECTLGTSNCDSNATCTNTIGSFTCTCDNGFSGDGVNCTDIDECTLGTSSCDSNASCTNTIGSFTCTCDNGFSGNGTICSDIDECTMGAHTCDSNATCTNTIGSFTCACNSGFSGNGTTCSDIDECSLGTHTCGSNATCTNTVGSFTCTCDSGFSGDGVNCTDIDECTLGTHTCDSNATCTNTIGSFTCTCDAGFTGDGVNCTDIDECISNPCLNNGTCINGINMFTCNCTPGFTNVNCTPSVLYDDCSTRADVCDGIPNADCNGTVCACSTGHYDPGNNTCVPVDCGSLSPPANGFVDTTPGTTYNLAASYTCDTGYNLTAGRIRFCLENGSWAGEDPMCVLDDCGPLTNITNGYVSTPGGTTYNQTATYVCDTGYFISAGNETRVCQDGGAWSGMEPNCTIYDCGSLSNITNGIVTYVASTFGEIANYTCDTGYFIDGGNASRTCRNGTWDGLEPNCTIYDCGSLNMTMANGTVINTGGSVYQGTYNYTCDTGFYIVQGVVTMTLTCLSNGSWDDMVPTCTPVDCGMPEAPENGQVNTEPGTGYLDYASYTCNHGYLLSGSNIRQCLADGTYESSTPVCNIIDCGNLTDPVNGNVTLSNGTTFGQLAVYICDTGYQAINGSLQRTCSITGNWTGSEPFCEIYDCGSLSTNISNGNATQTGTVYQSMTTYMCDTGYWIMPYNVSELNVTCNATGSWDNELPACVIIDCGPLSAPNGGQINVPNTTYNSIASYTCDTANSWTLNGTNARTCGLDGQWSDEPPVCIPIDCGNLTAISNGNFTLTLSTYYNSVATYSCYTGYYLVGNTDRVCQLNSTWNGTDPTCVIYDCGNLTLPANGSINLIGTTYGETASFNCDVGYDLNGASLITCLDNGNWSDSTPYCQIKDCGDLTSGNMTYYNISVSDTPSTSGLLINPGNYTSYNNLTHVISGTVELNGTTYGQIAMFYCYVGFRMIGSNESTCQSYGNWTSDVPTCLLIDCGPLSNPVDGEVTLSNGTFYNSTANYTCNLGYYLEGDNMRVCGWYGNWTGTMPTCTIQDCGTLTARSNVNTIVSTTTYGSVAEFSCSVGYNLTGNDKIFCQANGNWSAPEPICELVDCGSLTSPGNGSVSVIATTFNQFANYSCNPGYTLSGSSIRICQSNGQWSGIEAVCIPKDCGQLFPPPNGYVNVSEGTLFGSRAYYRCDIGHQLDGPNSTICSTAGIWDPLTGPTCTIRDCGPLSAPDNGQMDTSSGTTYGQTAIFSCNPGYTLIGQNSSLCQEDGLWNATTFSCQIKDCGPVNIPVQGNVTRTNGTVYGSVATFYCDIGYYLNGKRHYNCTETGVWSLNGTSWPDCILVDCGDLNSGIMTYYNLSVSGNLSTAGLLINPGNQTSYNNLRHVISGTMELNGTTYGQMAMFYCFVGFRMIGSNESICQSNGNWSSDVPSCHLIDCGPLSSPIDGEVMLLNGTFYNSTATYTCNLGYYLDGDNMRVCGWYGNWTGTSPTCTIQDCGPLTRPSNGNIVVTSTTFGSIAEFSCSVGYDLFGVDKVFCQANGNWSDPEPTCQLTDCGPLSSPANGTISVVVSTFNQFANYSCNPGYTISGSSIRVCQSNGQWSGTVPTCTPKDCGQLLPPVNGYVNTSAGTTFGTRAVYGCNTGYRLDGPESATCSSSGSWDPPSSPVCTIRDCGQLTHPANGQVDISFGTTYNKTATFTCNTGYNMNGFNTTLCQADGMWNFTSVTCQIKDCGTIEAPTDGTLAFTQGTVYGSVVTFSCNTGYYLNGTSVYNCTETGEWSLNETSWPGCVLYDCGNLTTPMNGDVAYLNSLGSKYGGQAMYSCGRGYMLNGTEIIQCTSTGSWSLTEPPVCEIKDCGPISAPANGSLKLTNGTVYESVANFTCDCGFNLTGSGVINCTDTGMWSDAEPVCMPFDCGPLRSPANGNVTLTYGTLYTSLGSYYCDVGYNLTGPQTRECNVSGQWEPIITSSPTNCVIIDCGTLQNPVNGNVDLSNGTTYGQTAMFSCSVGYDVFGSSTIICQADGQWSSNAPTCQITDCGGLNGPDNGYVTATNTTFGQLAQYSCREGFQISAETTRVCQPDGNWSIPIPTCSIRDCGQLPEFQFGSIALSSGTTFGSIATYNCSTGYNMQGNSTQTCTANGTWDGVPPVCTIHDCGNIPIVDNSIMSSYNTTSYGTVLTFMCIVGYNMSGSNNVSCTPNGWEMFPTCMIIDCGPLSDPTDGIVIVQRGTTYRQTATYFCNTGYILEGSNQQTCTETGQWNSSAPSCRKADCGEPDPISNGTVSLEPDTTYRSTALYVCNVGYQLNGSSSVFCQANENWNGEAPACLIRDCGPLSDPLHGNVTLNSTTYGSVAVYACSSLYNLDGASTVICRSNGSWSDSPPKCVLNNAQDINAQMSFNVEVTGNLSNPTVYRAYKQETEQSLNIEFTSLMGSDLLGVDVTGLMTGSLIANFTVVVKDTSQATQSLSQAMASQLGGSNLTLFNQPVQATLTSVGNTEDCGIPSNITNGLVETPQGTKFGSTIIYTCNEGYTLDGFNTRMCLLNGSYASTEPSCTPKDCGPLSNPTNGQVITQSGTTVGNVAIFLCNPGYSLIGQSQIICQFNGNWSDVPPTCQFTLCGGLQNPSNGKVSVSIDGRLATYSCDDGYLLQGTNDRVCSVVTASWTETQPTCLQIDCGLLLDPDNGLVDITTGTTFGKVATYTCVTLGYILIGPENRVCGTTGWNGTEPNCSLADCGAVNPILNGQLNLTGTTFGNTATYMCDEGYRIIGEPVLGCTLAGWNFQEPICFPNSSCPNLLNPPNGVVTVTGGNSYGAQAYYQCYTGYVLNGTSVRTCLTNGTWSGAVPTCNIQECPILSDPAGGDFMMPNGNTYAETAFYMCNNGYNMIGPQVVTCQQDGTWSHITTCEIKDCGPAPTVENGNVDTLAGTTYNSTAVYTCNPGYDLDGQSEIKCLDTGSWEKNLPTCVIKDCGPLEHPDNGFVNLNGTTYGQTAIYSCNTGYNLTGSMIRQCTEFGVWTGSKPFCNVIECGPAPSITNGQFSLSNGFSYGSVITYSCNHGYLLSTSPITSVCTETGSWSNMNTHTCQLVDCGPLTAPAHGQVILFNDTLYGSTAQYSCITGYLVVGNPVRNCTASGQWTQYLPTCTVADCGLLTDPINGDVEFTGGTMYGATAVYKCNSQHNLKGTAMRNCGENGTWSGDPPRCDSTEFALAVGLGVGLTGFVLLVIIIALIVAIMYRRHVRKRQARRQRYRKITRNAGMPVSSVPLKATTSSYIVPYINRTAWYSNNHLADGSVSSYDDWKRWKADDGDQTNPLYNNATVYQSYPREEENQGNPIYTYYRE